MIRVEDVTLRVGGNDVLVGASMHLHPADHVGLVGANGSGKTTLLRAMLGELSPDEGRVVQRNGARVGWLPQQAVSGSERAVWDEARSAMVRINALREELEAAQEAVQSDPEAADRLDRATEAFRLAGGFAVDERIGEVLHGLGFKAADWQRRCDTFSGGWQMRIALARLLLSDPDVALLDEPTNHLDLEARSWLAGFLAKAPWAFVVVSHDRWLLQRCASRVVEVAHNKLASYTGSYDSYLRQREAQRELQQSAFERQQKEIAKLEGFVERFGAKATKAAQARSRKNRLERMERVDAPESERRGPRFRLPEPPSGSMEALALRSADVGWTAEQPVLRGVDLTLTRGTRTVLLGPNGCGKSTILQTLAGRLKPLGGRRVVGDRVRVGLFSQDLAASLPVDVSSLEHLSAEVPTVPPERIRAVLGALGLPGDMALRPIGALSGGERARVALAALVVRPANVLLLDEPTNHLDTQTTSVLAEALTEWPGALLLVTHDRWLVEAVATHVARIRPAEDSVLEVREGVEPSDFERDPMPAGEGSAKTAGAEDHAKRKRKQRELTRAQRRLAEIEQELPIAESRVGEIDEALVAAAMDHVRATELGKERDAATSAVEALYEEWESLERTIDVLRQ
ncbi:MAG: ABC-F family ATP-binding cassette domain-containing protein [Myxococcales bacterium]|nr:ABC-F family ATP-binding cassette domain-containing protein [Myxococcales bacterium]